MSGDVEQDYFCDGMVEEIITGLSRIKWLFVIARNSSFVYKGKSIDVKQVGRELGVRYVLEGSVRKAANRVRITGQLIEAESGAHLWAERYDRPLDDIFALQDEITLSVVGAIEPSLRQAEIERVKRKRPNSLDAYDLVLKAIPHIYTLMPEGAAKAIPLLTDALALEPDYALAHGFAAWSYEILFVRAGMHEENRRSAIRHAHEAIAHGRGDAMALTLGGFVVSIVERDRVAAVEAFEEALGVSPSSAFTYLLGGAALGWAGEAERAITWGERGLRLSPVDLPVGPFIAISLGNFQLEHYAEAANAARRAIQANPGFTVCHVLFAAALDLAQWPQIGFKRRLVGEPYMIAEELQVTGVVRGDQHLQKQPAEQRRENLHGQEIAWSARDPLRSIRRQAATRHDHVHMRVVGERRAPGVQHRHEANASAEMLGISGDRERGLGRGFEQQVVDHRLVLIGDVGDCRWQRVHHMKVWHR